MKRNLFITFTLSCLGTSAAMGMSNVSQESLIPQDEYKFRDSLFTGSAAFRANQLIDDVGEVTGNKHYADLNLKYQSFTDSNVYKGIDISARINDREQMMYSIKEARIQYNYSTSRLAFGRSSLDWSYTDKDWGLGVINNRVNFDFFEPGEEGLTGIFYDKKFENGFHYSLFGSFTYVPELNPGLKIDKKNGTVTCQNPWCDAPSSTAPINNTDVPIFYNVNYPDLADVIFRYSVGARIGYEINNVNIEGYYLKKPENSISTTAEIQYETDKNRLFVDVTPQFFYHEVIGGNFDVKINEYFKMFGSVLSIRPNTFPEGDEPYIQYTGIKPKKKKEEYMSGGLAYGDGLFSAKAGYIARISEFDKENDLLVKYPRWNQAVHLNLNKKFTRKIEAELDYKFDMLTEDRIVLLKTNYRFGQSLIVGLGLNMIGTNPEKESFWSDFENNDSVYSSLKYTF